MKFSENYINKKIAKKKYKKIILIVRDQEDSLEKLLEYIKKIGNIGHSFSIIVDPNNKDYRLETGWDGDGSDRIMEIKVENIEED